MKLKIAAFTAVLALPGFGLAACPGADDLANGIWVSFADNSVSKFQTTPLGQVAETIYDGTETPLVLEVDDGIHIVREYNMKDGVLNPQTVKVYTYAEALTEPTPGKTQTVPVTVSPSPEELVKDPNAKGSEEVYRITYGPVGTLQIGSCSYASQIVAILYETPGVEGWTSQVNFLPEVGIALISATGEMGKVYDTFYKAQAISATQPELPKP